MLVLTRKAQEEIIIGQGLVNIKILSISKSQIKIGVDAPQAVSIHRKEIFKAIAPEITSLVTDEEYEQSFLDDEGNEQDTELWGLPAQPESSSTDDDNTTS